uniref:Major allergen Pru ar 1 n=1 Tax=Anthurium amnicola TaxID=1678845 RepID=A0A1D1Y3P9_9ARAE
MTGYSVEFPTQVAASRLFRVSALESHNIVPKIIPEIVSSASVVHGNGDLGTVTLFKFTDAVPYDCIKERLDVLDKKNLEYTHTLLEGGPLGRKLQSGTYNVKFQPTADGGSVVKITVDCHPKPGVELTEEDMKVDKEDILGMFKAVEAYLLANPDAYA